jgi:Mn-dependent DtxR family transcriptional regulator
MSRIALQERKQKVLQIVIHHYIRTAKPVGSETIIEKYKLEVSPATVRNILAELEKEGFMNGAPVTYFSGRTLGKGLEEDVMCRYGNWHISMACSDNF